MTEENNTFSDSGTNKDVIIWSMDSDWKQYGLTTDVWYQEISNQTTVDTDYYILSGSGTYTNGAIQVDSNVKKGDVTTNPKLTFKAAAVQSANIGGLDAAYNELGWN